VANHGERDHSGALPALMHCLPDIPIYCTSNAVKSIKGQYHQDWNFVPVKTGDHLSIGSQELRFFEAPMLHWPDTMFTHLSGDNVLFSNDAFGQHYASELMFNDLVDQAELFQEAIKYYANILTPFSKIVDRKIQELLSSGLSIEMICPSHGVIWRHEPTRIVTDYLRWSHAFQEDQISILYDTMWNGTRLMAEALARGLRAAAPDSTVKLFNVSRSDSSDILTEIFKSKAILVGSPTVNKGVLSSLAGLLEEMKGLRFTGKKAAAFGSYGWSGESVKVIESALKDGGFELICEGIRKLWYPGEEELADCEQFARAFVAAL
jgi:flavorubredoxin